MKVSDLFLNTTRETPREATAPSHQMLVRAGYLFPVSSGVYGYLPLLWRVIRKIRQIVREEMDRTGALELNLPLLQAKSYWDETARWDVYRNAGILFRLRDRRGEEYCLAPTAEEVMTHYVRLVLKSHRQLPITLYQIGEKFRDEIRPRFGIIRGREFIMKDAYSFDRDEAGMRRSYEFMRAAYARVCERCGLRFRMVEADSGAIGGSESAEFMVLAPTGEDTILECDHCDYGANLEKAESRLFHDAPEAPKPLEQHDTPNIRTVEQLTEYFDGLPARKMVKTIIYSVTGGTEKEVAICIRGDLEINEVKLTNHLKATSVATADAETVARITNAPVGFAGPVELTGVRIIADDSIKPMVNFLCGINTEDVHLINVNCGRDFPVPEFTDLKKAQAGDGCPQCQNGLLKTTRGIEMGHIFMLQTNYSTAMNLTFTDDEGVAKPVWMGCYGIGVSRIAAAAVEQYHDERGIVWPESIAPYRVIIVPVKWENEQQQKLAVELYESLLAVGVETLLDDRLESPGRKFADADLIGIPWRITVGRNAEEGKAELLNRRSGDSSLEEPDAIINRLSTRI